MGGVGINSVGATTHCIITFQKNILFVGVEWERKGGVQLFEAFKLVLKKIPDATLTIVGCAPSIQHLNVNVVGKISIEKVPDYYNQASVFCMPTRLEPFGIVFLEAMYHQLPIVASNIGAANDFIEDNKNGYLLPPDDTVGISNQLIYLEKDNCFIFFNKRY